MSFCLLDLDLIGQTSPLALLWEDIEEVFEEVFGASPLL